MSDSLIAVVREALDALGSGAANADDLTGSEIAKEGIAALDKIETAVLAAYHRPIPTTGRWFCQVCRRIGGHSESCPASLLGWADEAS